MEIQRIMERLGKLENQVASINFKLQAIDNILKPDAILRKVREAEAEEKRKAEMGEGLTAAAAELLNKKD